MKLKHLKAVFGVLLLLFLLGEFDYVLVFRTIVLSNAMYIALGFLMFFLSAVFEVYKFFLLLPKGFVLVEAAKISYVGLFFNNFMPSNIGGDAYRIFRVAKKNGYRFSSIIVLMDRFNGLALIILLSLFVLYLRPVNFPEINMHIDLVIFWIAVVVFASVFFRKKISVYAKKILDDVRLLPISRYFLSVLHSFLFHIFRIIGIYFFLLAVGGEINIVDIAVVLSIVLLVSVIPISVGALGVREAAFVAGFSMYSIDPVLGLAVALLTRIFLLLQATLGFFVFSYDN